MVTSNYGPLSRGEKGNSDGNKYLHIWDKSKNYSQNVKIDKKISSHRNKNLLGSSKKKKTKKNTSMCIIISLLKTKYEEKNIKE